MRAPREFLGSGMYMCLNIKHSSILARSHSTVQAKESICGLRHTSGNSLNLHLKKKNRRKVPEQEAQNYGAIAKAVLLIRKQWECQRKKYIE